MRFRAQTSLLLLALLFLVGACARGKDPGAPTAPDPVPSRPVNIPTAGTLQPGHNLLGYWEITIDSESGTWQIVPARLADIHLNVLSWLEYVPCTNCLKILNFEKLPNKDLQFDVELTHPFIAPNLTGFDVRGIAMFGGDFQFPALGLTASSNMEDNPELLNPDGHTTLYNPSTEGNGYQGYLKGKMAPSFAAPNAKLNAYKVYYSDPNRRYFLAGANLTSPTPYLIRSPLKVFTFGYAVDASWAKPTTPVNVPGSFPLAANSIEAYQISTGLSNSLASNEGATATLTIDVYDWQGVTTVGAVHVEAPLFYDGLIEATPQPGGPATKRFTCELVNQYGFVPQGSYPICIRVLDTESITTPGALIDNIAYRIVQVPVIINHAPTCAAEVSNDEPEVGEEITFTDISTDPEGPGDLKESWWDFYGTGDWVSGFVVKHTYDQPGVYPVNHRIVDNSGASDELDSPLLIDAGLFITLQEDYENKVPGTGYHYQSLDHTYDSGAVINVDDLDGPWDFTTAGLLLGSNWRRIIDDTDPEVAGFVDEFNENTTHFVKFENMFDPFFPVLYQAEYHHFASNKLYIYGFYDPYLIGASPFGPPDTDENLTIPFPLTVDTDYSFDIVKPSFVLNYSLKAIGEGDVTVPYGGGTTYHCLLLRYRFTVSAPEPVNGGTLDFAFVSDSGLVVANVAAVNDPPQYNWNPSSNTIYSSGNAMFQALDSIE